MVFITVRGVEIDFPFTPYECQVTYMEKVIECLQEGKNGILESPTGTGKTLCLLCATLAWRRSFAANMQLQGRMCIDSATTGSTEFHKSLKSQLQQATGSWDTREDEQKMGSSFEVPKIIYASRTHSQLSQAVQELKNTVYSPKVSILGSREQLCINSEVMKQEMNSAKIHMCRAKVQAKGCHFHNNLDANKANPDFTHGILDIEDLVSLGQKHRACPYYMARELKNSADIIFMPYNYLLDSKSRKANGIDISGNIIIFDEAHNLEKMCEESASFDLTSFDIASCIEDVDKCLEQVINQTENAEMTDSTGSLDLAAEDVAVLKALFRNLEDKIDAIPFPKNSNAVAKPGNFMFELLAQVNITFGSKNQLLDLLDKCNSFLAGETQIFKGKHFALQKFSDALQTIFSRESIQRANENVQHELSKFYKVHIQVEENSKKKKNNLDVWTTGSKASKQGRTLSYWCFSPGHAMKDLVTYGIRSVVLTSGTLSPLQSFRAEMQIPFPVQLENPHVIEKHQMWVGIVTKAPDRATLNSSYEMRFTPEYMTGLGNSIANFARVVPNGMLVFFPSYPVMNKCLEHWQGSGIWNRIAQHKPLFAEPKGKGDFIETMDQFYEKVNDPVHKGAVFFAVCRGKVSEGLDFADNNGRAVVITGLPFPPKMDPRVKLKMEFLDGMLKNREFKGITGREWYRQQASRAVNQAVGRVIRHKQDYGAIVLCDERFTYPDAIRQLPTWVRPYVKIYKEFGLAQRDMIQFFRNADKLADKSAMKVKLPRRGGANSSHSVPTEHESQESTEQSVAEMASYQVDKSSQQSRTQRERKINRVQSATMRASEVPVSLARIQLQYESPDAATPGTSSRPQTSFLDSLTKTENVQCTNRGSSPEEKESTSLSASIMKSKNLGVQSRPKKVFKVVKAKGSTDHNKNGNMEGNSDKLQKLHEAKMYIQKVKSALSEESHQLFTQVLTNYKKDNNLDNLLSGLTQLFTQNKQQFPLFLGFSNYVRDPTDRKKFFQAYQQITGEDAPPEFVLSTKKRADCGQDRNCRVAKKAKLDQENTKCTKTESKEKAVKPCFPDSFQTQSDFLNVAKHLNGGRQ